MTEELGGDMIHPDDRTIHPADVLDPDDPVENACIARHNRLHHPGGTEAYDARAELERERYEEEYGCENCGGTGFLSDLARCVPCDGSGVIHPADPHG